MGWVLRCATHGRGGSRAGSTSACPHRGLSLLLTQNLCHSRGFLKPLPSQEGFPGVAWDPRAVCSSCMERAVAQGESCSATCSEVVPGVGQVMGVWKDHAVPPGHTKSLLMTHSPGDPAPRSPFVPAGPQPLLALDKDLAFTVSRASPSKPSVFPPLSPSYPEIQPCGAPTEPFDNRPFPLTLRLSLLCHGALPHAAMQWEFSGAGLLLTPLRYRSGSCSLVFMSPL